MHRSQIFLDEWRCQYVADESRRTGECISAIIRRWIAEKIGELTRQDMEDDPFFEVIGTCAGEPGKPVGRDHDGHIYAVDWKEREE